MQRRKRYLGYRFVKAVLGFLFCLVYRPVIAGHGNIPQTGGAVLAGNHKNAFDPALPALSTPRVLRFFAKKELHEGAFGFFFRAMATIPVNRSKKDNNIMSIAEDILKNGELISLFPEGTRNRTGEIVLPFKFGAVAMARRAGTPVVPFAITGEYKPFRQSVKITFGRPIDVSVMEISEANDYLREQVKELILNQTGDEKNGVS